MSIAMHTIGRLIQHNIKLLRKLGELKRELELEVQLHASDIERLERELDENAKLHVAFARWNQARVEELETVSLRDAKLAISNYERAKAAEARVTELEEGLQKAREANGKMFDHSVSKIVYDRVKAEGIKLAEVVSIQASRINELERQLFFLRREMERNETGNVPH